MSVNPRLFIEMKMALQIRDANRTFGNYAERRLSQRFHVEPSEFRHIRNYSPDLFLEALREIKRCRSSCRLCRHRRRCGISHRCSLAKH
jgi:hypothetical protein